MASWRISDGELERTDFDTRAKLAQRLRSGRLAQFTRLIGRFRQMAAAQRARRVENVPGEVVGIELGGDLPRLLPSGLANLALPGLHRRGSGQIGRLRRASTRSPPQTVLRR